MDGIPTRRRVFQADIALKEAASEKVLRLSNGTAVLEARGKRSSTAAVNAGGPDIVEGVAARLDVEDARGAQAELRRQCAGDQGDIADQGGVEERAKAADAVRKHDAVDANLHIGVLVAHMVIGAGGGILGNSGKLQHDLLDRCVLSLRQRLPWLRTVVLAASCSAGVTAAAGVGVTPAAGARAGRTCAAAPGLGLGFAARTTTSGSSTCATAVMTRQTIASNAKPASNHAQNTRGG